MTRSSCGSGPTRAESGTGAHSTAAGSAATSYGTVFGAVIAAPIWADIMHTAIKGTDTGGWDNPPSSMLAGQGATVPDVPGTFDRGGDGHPHGRRLPGPDRRPRSTAPTRLGSVGSTSPSGGDTTTPGDTVTIYPSTGNGGATNAGNPQPQPQPKPQPKPATEAEARTRAGRAPRWTALPTPDGQDESWRRTSAPPGEPSARRATRGWTAFITRPIAAGPAAPAADTSATASATTPDELLVGQLLRQVALEHRQLGVLALGPVGTAGLGVRGGGLAPLLGLAPEHALDLVVRQRPRAGSRDLRALTAVSAIRMVADRTSSRDPDRRR